VILTIKLLRIVGSPFVRDHELELPGNELEALELYNYAIKNKIGLLYLEALNDRGKLEEFRLKSNYEEEQEKYDKQLITVARVSELFNSSNVNYAVFKSIMPFPATPNDVDIIHFGSDVEFENAAELMLLSGYLEVKGQADAEQRMFHDARDGKLWPHPHQKDVYDVDLYQKISASHILYLDKRKLEGHVIEINRFGTILKVLKPEAELVAIVIHSIIPEMLCTLFVYYSTLYYLAKMNSREINEFIDIAKENNAVYPIKVHFSVLAELHQAAHGFIPAQIEEILTKLGTDELEKRNLFKNEFKTPHKYGLSTVVKTLLEKANEAECRRSVIKQLVYMLNPRHTKWVIHNIIWRRQRETY